MEDFGTPLDKNATELTVMDVYDIAAVVGKEFERIIDQFGCEASLRLMPKVVRVLEVLEVLVTRNNINPETEELRRELDRLRMERNDRLKKEQLHQKELELVEDVWRGEAQDLLSQITQLQVENKSLRKSLSLKDSPVTEDLQRQEGVSERECQVMKKLKEVVDKQRDEIRDKDHELKLKNEDLEALQLQQHHLMKINLDLRHRISVVEAQGKAVIQQKAELEAMSQARQQELGALRREVARLKEERKEWELDMKRSAEEEPSPSKSVMTVLTPVSAKSLVLASAASVVHNSFWAECRSDHEFLAQCFESGESPPVLSLCDKDQEEEPDVLDQKESDRPHFTLEELRDVLKERNELKAQVFMLREELIYYKSEELENEIYGIDLDPSLQSQPAATEQPDSGIKRLIFTAVMPMVAAGLIADDPTLQPIRRLMSCV
ncbi:RILP-like protein 1 isoform X2 [Oncorhynchus keta]|uniref:RILP-like protein 1 isoform X1 n=1 Tax=Oncorhynchus keta TaxID=8018 RepID=UPI0015FB5D7E|nr:RILP-like protein 1 isoform X1 [Oncorhynchus keta]XP_035592012.1 RILP-like protein 1 isoform X2 [Oncorhynchus keta]